jgi:NAD+ kinase
MRISNVIVVNKKTFYEFCFLDKSHPGRLQQMSFSHQDLARFKKMHLAHQKTLKKVKRVLEKYRVRYRVSYRKTHIPYDSYDLVITVGGDGTFLQAARQLSGQKILGVNSDPQRSIGKFCLAQEKNFEKVFLAILSGKAKPKRLARFSLTTRKQRKSALVLNDILICDANPAAMSRYVLTIGKKVEDQRSSGIWVSTASGSTGAIHSSGGMIFNDTSTDIQYRPRELYHHRLHPCRLGGGILSLDKPVKVRSMMRKGVIYIDGAHFKIPFSYGDEVSIRRASSPTETFMFPS